MGKTTKSVLLFSPNAQEEKKPNQWAPLSFLALGSALEDKGYEVIIVDEKMEANADRMVRDVAGKALFMGITSMTGTQIFNGIRMVREAKKVNPELPIIWGGWHPSLAPDSTIASPHVDIVVEGQGEETIVEVAERLSARQSLKGVPGILYKEDGRVVRNSCRPFKDPNLFKRAAYHLLDLKKYQEAEPRDVVPRSLPASFGKMKAINYVATYGCPFKCTFCSVTTLFHQRHYALSVERVLDDLEYLTDQGFNTITFEDSLFFVNKPWVKAVCEGMIERGLNLKWHATARATDILKYDDDLMKTIRKSGCLYVFIGAESGSQAVLEMIDKGKTVKAAHTVEAVRRLSAHGITNYLNYIVGLPGEPPRSYWDTMQQIKDVKDVSEETVIAIGAYAPYPGTPLFEAALSAGLKQPETLEGWAAFTHQHVNVPSGISPDLLRRIRFMNQMYLPFVAPSYSRKPKKIRDGFGRFLRWATRLRLQKRWLPWSWEVRLYWRYQKLKRSLSGAPG